MRYLGPDPMSLLNWTFHVISVPIGPSDYLKINVPMREKVMTKVYSVFGDADHVTTRGTIRPWQQFYYRLGLTKE